MARWLVVVVLATFRFTAPTLNADGTELCDLALVRLYRCPPCGARFGPVREWVGIEPGAAVEFVDVCLGRFYVVAVDTAGNESLPSDTVAVCCP